jgi:hypothetical protein
MDDFKSLESTMSSQMSGLCEIIAQLMQAKAPSAPPKIPATLNRSNVGRKKRMPIKIKIKMLGHLLSETGKVNSLIGIPPPVPHPHINNRGDPPKLDALNFGQWQY